MNILKAGKRIGILAMCGTMMSVGGLSCIPAMDVYADTVMIADAKLGTISISGFPSNLKSFQIYNYNNDPITYNGKTYKIGALIAIIPVAKDGTASISGLPYGTYRVKEYKTKTGYSSNKNFYTIKLVDDTDQNLVPEETDEIKYGSILLRGADGISLNGMEFELKNVGTAVNYDGRVVKAGEVMDTFSCNGSTLTIKNLPYGAYELTQLTSVDGVHMDHAAYTINIINEDEVELIIQVANHEHNWNGGEITKEPTCTEKGETTYHCLVCNGTKTEPIQPLGHSYFTKEPTCLEDGLRICTRCDKEDMVLPKTGHKWDEGRLVGNVSCTENAKRIYTCTYCGEEKTVVLPRTNNHSYKTEIVKGTNGKPGYIKKTCTKCGHIETETEIAQIGNVELDYTEAEYTGKALKPGVKVYDANGKEISKSYYSVAYYSNINVGIASVKVSMKGNYTGTITEQFEILPKGTNILSITPIYHGFTVKWAKQDKEVTGYEIEYATDEAFSDAGLLQTTKYTTLAKTITGLKPNTKYYLKIRTYKGSSYSHWSATRTVITKQ